MFKFSLQKLCSVFYAFALLECSAWKRKRTKCLSLPFVFYSSFILMTLYFKITVKFRGNEILWRLWLRPELRKWLHRWSKISSIAYLIITLAQKTTKMYVNYYFKSSKNNLCIIWNEFQEIFLIYLQIDFKIYFYLYSQH